MRLVLRKHLVDALVQMDEVGLNRRQIRQILQSQGGMRQLVAKVQQKLKTDPSGRQFLTLGNNAENRGKLFAWLWEHRAEILSFVLEIVKLFKTVA